MPKRYKKKSKIKKVLLTITILIAFSNWIKSILEFIFDVPQILFTVVPL